MMILGLILLVLGFVLGMSLLVWLGVALLVIGLVLMFVPNMTGGRRFY